jgi:hypothetical protein
MTDPVNVMIDGQLVALTGDALTQYQAQAAADLSSANSPQILSDYAYAKMHAVLGAGQIFNVAESGQPALNVLCDGGTMTRADLSLLALYGQQNPSGVKTWVDNNNVATQLTGAQFVTLANLAMGWVADCYASIGTLLAQIAAGTITTTAPLDAFSWPTS